MNAFTIDDVLQIPLMIKGAGSDFVLEAVVVQRGSWYKALIRRLGWHKKRQGKVEEGRQM